MNRLKLIIPPLPWHQPRHRPAAGERVVLLHGLWRSTWSMEALAEQLHKNGHETLNIPYASFRKSLHDIVDDVAAAIPDHHKITHFVTHSMGGIIIRCLAHRHPHLITGRIVMLAPPNQGSEIIDWLEDCPLARWSLGPGGLALSTQKVKKHIPGFSPHHQVTAIMGKRQSLPFFNSLLKGQHDGIVTVAGGQVAGPAQLEVVHADHTFIVGESTVIQRVAQLLE